MKKPVPAYALMVPENAAKVFDGEIYDVYQWPQEMFDGTTATFEMLKRADTVVIYAATGDEELIVLEEVQPHSSGPYITLPSGRVEDGEDVRSAAERELEEETGMSFETVRLIGVEQPHPKIEHFAYIFAASGFVNETEQQLDGGEKITVKRMSFSEYKQLVTDGQVPLDVFTLRQIARNPKLTLSDILNLSEIK